MGEPGAELASRTRRRLLAVGHLANGVSAVAVFVYTGFFYPGAAVSSRSVSTAIVNIAVFVPYLALTLYFGPRITVRPLFDPVADWLRSDRPAGPDEQLAVLRLPAHWARRLVVPWLGALVIFTLLNLNAGPRFVATTAVSITLGTIMTTALQYLLVEQVLRPVTARALGGGVPGGRAIPGVTARLAMAWTLAAGIPLVGIVGAAVTAPLGQGMSRDRLAVASAVLAAVGLVAGVAAIRLSSRSIAAPLLGLQDGFAAIEAGRFDHAVVVDDGSEIGRLQAGFNTMVAGLREREQLREAFGSYVDPGLTERILRDGVDLAGEEVELSVMFVDVRGFTALAEATPATEVVARLNELYTLIVPIITRHGGHAAKFIGDGLLAVFGAPERLEDHADRAVRCAAEIIAATTARPRGLRVGVGVNSGMVVAGTIGGGGRRDFTVIGDTVNTAARVEATTRHTGDDVLITDATRRLLTDGAAWQPRPAIPLKGKTGQAVLFAPAKDSGPATGQPALSPEQD